MPRAVLFDLYNTLVAGATDAERTTVGRTMGIDLGADQDSFAALFARMWPQRRVGALGDVEAAVRTVSAHLGVTPSDSAVRLAAARQLALTRKLLWPSAMTLATLDRLRSTGWRLGLVCNAAADTPQMWKRTPLAQRFDAVGFSCELGVAKPDPAIFLSVCSFLSVAPTDCLYVGDGDDNELSAAASLGMSVVQTYEFLPASGSWPRQRIGALHELVNGQLA